MAQPNILLFLTDDHGPWSLEAYGNRDLKTPNFSRLVQKGTLFRNAFTPCPVCSPARACIMTGRTPSQVGIHDWLQENVAEIGNRDWLATEVTLPELLNDSGYHTILSGKWHLGQSHQTPRGFDRCFGLPSNQGMHSGKYTYHQDGVPVELDGNKSGLITDRALQMLAEAPIEQPFFLNIGYIATHSPYAAKWHDPRLVSEIKQLNLSVPDLPHPHAWANNEGAGDSPTNEQILDFYQGYYSAVLEIDRNIGRVLDTLEGRGLLDNTLVIYVSDHGCALGHQGFWGKGNSTRPLNMYDVSVRVPLIVSGPGIAQGHEVTAPVDHYDLFGRSASGVALKNKALTILARAWHRGHGAKHHQTGRWRNLESTAIYGQFVHRNGFREALSRWTERSVRHRQ